MPSELTEETIAELERLEMLGSQPLWEVGSFTVTDLHIRINHGRVEGKHGEQITVIAKIELSGDAPTDIDRIDAALICAMRNALPGILAERKEKAAELADYRNAVTWNVDCVQCAKYLDKSVEDYTRIKELESQLAERTNGEEGYKRMYAEAAGALQRLHLAVNPETDYIGPGLSEHDILRIVGTLRVQVNKGLDRERAMRSALRELVTLKDQVKDSDPADYDRRKPEAWEAARQAIGTVSNVDNGTTEGKLS